MKQNKLLREIVVIITAASLLGIAYNFIASPKKIALIREEAKPLEQASDSLLFGPTSTTSQTNTPPQTVMSQPTQVQTPTKDTVIPNKPTTTQLPVQATKSSTPPANTPPSAPPKSPEKVEPAAVTYQQVLRLLEDKDVLFIDSRSDHEWAEGHIPGAIHIFAEEFQQHVPEVIGLPRDKRIVVYCSGGPECNLSHEVCENLAAFGFNRLFIYFGGWTEWKKMKAEGK
ncbi:MAG: hypothetical protein IPM69_19250 [Ignavibacteria bacterium]|nr:hypothetical protein [Ignavibacteria bacterium]